MACHAPLQTMESIHTSILTKTIITNSMYFFNNFKTTTNKHFESISNTSPQSELVSLNSL